jgi:adenylate kinase
MPTTVASGDWGANPVTAVGGELLRALMLGPPGSGKGTQGERLAVRHGVPHLSSGELLRIHVRQGTVLGRAAAETMRRGDLVPDDIVTDIMREQVVAPNAGGGFVLDGYPRTVRQAEAAYEEARRNGITFHAVVLLEVPPDELLDRLTRRGRIAGRTDDTSVAISHRVEVYLDQTSPLIDYYEGRDILVRIDATGSIDEVTAAINAQLDRLVPPPTPS